MSVTAAFYGLLAFEGSFLAIRPVNALSRCTDWTVGHVHSGTLGWLAMIVFGSLYTLVPHLAGQDGMRWPRAVERHFRLGVPATLVHVVAMWNAGVPQGLMWRTMTQVARGPTASCNR
nr:cbb3-type cytochrome c oxidase subunit I [Paracoccus sp. pheM1]